ncbi:MAG: hypothetical protein AABZ61_02670, partial [Bacteroidota bacterium]
KYCKSYPIVLHLLIELVTLVDEDQDAGFKAVEFDARLRPSGFGGQASGLASGVYFYQLKAGSFIQSKKLILIR